MVTITPSASNKYGGAITYRYEYSTDGGANWYMTAQSKSTAITFTVPVAQKIRFRVKASDDTGFSSTSYTTGPDMTIINNIAPYAPRSISVGTVTAGVDVSVTWEEATDPDGTITGYTLQRAVDGGSFQTVYTGMEQTCTDKTDNRNWAVVQYRVRAADNQGAYSGWTTSPLLTVLARGITFPDGGILEQFENPEGKPVFPLTVVEGVFRQSDGKSLAAILEGVAGGSGSGGQGEPGEPGPGVPAGGKKDQMLVKRSAEDYDTEWVDPPSIPPTSSGGSSMSEVTDAISNATKNMVTSASIRTIVALTEEAYGALSSKNADTLYLIKE